MNPEMKAILDALLESRRILEARLDSMDARLTALDAKVDGLDTKVQALDTKVQALDTKVQALDTKLNAVATDVAVIKEQVSDMSALDQFLTQKTGELEAELFVIKRRQKA